MTYNLLITGTSGMLGKDIFSIFSQKAEYNVYGVDIILNENIPVNSQFIGNLTDLLFTKDVLNTVKPDIIIHCAAIVSLDKCETDKKLAKSIHVDVTKQLANYNINKTKIIYISTDSVFDGKDGDYSETDKPNPINYYAKSKLQGEVAACVNSNNLIIRTNIFGFNRKLGGSIAEWAIKNFMDNKMINGFTDTFFNAIYTKQLAEILLKLIQINYKGLVNVASQNYMTKYDFLKVLAKELNVSDLLIIESTSSLINFNTPRPLNTTLNTSKLKKIVNVPKIEDGMKELVIDLLHNKDFQI
jgi:dTDP-4-dehydrorhamnose reductase